LIDAAATRTLLPVVVTFEPHPLKVLAPKTAPTLITTTDQKLRLMAAAGIPCVVLVRFTLDFAAVTAERFVSEWLCDSLGMEHIVIGHDYAFGRGRTGDYRTLEFLGAERGFSVEYMDPVGDEGLIFSSSIARKLIATGDLAGAARVLGRYHQITGHVVHGSERGRGLGFPTANVATANELLPPDGVYATMVQIGDELIAGACNIGRNPTFAGEDRTVEVFLLDFDRRIYGCEIALWFVERLRGERTFADGAELAAAIAKDVARTRGILDAVDHGLLKPIQDNGVQ
jgi:riboflavin kinase/FMN adenylyltransferase